MLPPSLTSSELVLSRKRRSGSLEADHCGWGSVRSFTPALPGRGAAVVPSQMQMPPRSGSLGLIEARSRCVSEAGSTDPSQPPFRKRFKMERGIDISTLLDVSAVGLRGEATDNVPVFETCDMVRGRIRAFLDRPGMTQAAFLRAIAATYSDGRRLQGAQLNRFLAMKGPNSGNTSGIFYASYVFFEKMRIRDGRPKSPDRLEMERQHPAGFNVSDIKNPNQLWGLKGEKFVGYDKYGKLQVA